MIYIGIDPGKSGGIAFVSEKETLVEPMPDTLMDLFELLNETYQEESRFCYLERVSSSPQMGVRSAFTFGFGFGSLQMALLASRIPFELITPATWQRELKCLTKGDKNITKRKAQQLFPDMKVTHKTADALLIAEYCRRTRGGKND